MKHQRKPANEKSSIEYYVNNCRCNPVRSYQQVTEQNQGIRNQEQDNPARKINKRQVSFITNKPNKEFYPGDYNFPVLKKPGPSIYRVWVA